MNTVEQQIEQSQAKKKALLRNVALGIVCVLILGGGALIVTQIPDAPSPSPVAASESEPLPEREPQANIDRAPLQQSLTETKQAIAPVIDDTKNILLFADRSKALDDKMKSAYDMYGKGEYLKSKLLLDGIVTDSQVLASDFKDAYTAPFQKARTAFSQDNIAAAIKLNRQSLRINPNYSPAQKLQERIDVYSQVQDAYEQARVGEVENDLIKQRDALSIIVQLDPQRSDAKARLSNVETTLDNNRFSDLLSKASAAVNRKSFAKAKDFLAKAAKIKPNSPELATIQSRVKNELTIMGQTSAEQQVTTFTAADEWLTVKMLAEKGLQKYPNSPTLQQALHSATRIIEAEQTIDVYTANPTRLADQNVRNIAQSDIASFDNLRNLSASLSAKLDNLNALIEKQNQPLPVTITSDDRTYIKVLGVGVVGETDEKVVKLKPGRYQIEGSRQGYRSKVVDLVVEPSDTPITIHIECDERV